VRVPLAVVDDGAPAGRRLHRAELHDAAVGDRGRRRLEQVQRVARVAPGPAHERLARVRRQVHASAQATGVRDGAVDQLAHLLRGERVQHQHPEARGEGGVDLVVGVLGGRPD
jgi:hypothetical protein